MHWSYSCDQREPAREEIGEGGREGGREGVGEGRRVSMRGREFRKKRKGGGKVHRQWEGEGHGEEID